MPRKKSLDNIMFRLEARTDPTGLHQKLLNDALCQIGELAPQLTVDQQHRVATALTTARTKIGAR